MAINVQTKTKRSGKKGKRIPKKNRCLYNKYVQSQVAHISYDMPWIHLSSTIDWCCMKRWYKAAESCINLKFLMQSDWNSLVFNSVSVRRHKSMRNRSSSVTAQSSTESSIRNVFVMSSHHSLRMLKVIAQEQVTCAKRLRNCLPHK